MPSFNGQVTGVFFSTREEAFVSTVTEYNDRIAALSPRPEKGSCKYRHTLKVVDSLTLAGNEHFNAENVDTSPDPIFAEEYAVSGWFKWNAPADQQTWHTAFRFTVIPDN